MGARIQWKISLNCITKDDFLSSEITSAMLALERLRREDLEFEASLGYIDPISNKQNKTKRQTN
jgi:hypothetical protein